jgi:hypothetical protein
MRMLVASSLAALAATLAQAQAPSPVPPPPTPIPVERPPSPASGTIELKPTGEPGKAAASRLAIDKFTITAIDVRERIITVRRRNGETQTFKLGPEVDRLKEYAVGDSIKIEYEQGLVLEFQPPGSENVPMESGVTAGRSDRNQLPGSTASSGVQGTVTITAIDAAKRLVSFQVPAGKVYQVKAGPAIRIEKLKVGDRLLATYVETVAVRLEKDLPRVKK